MSSDTQINTIFQNEDKHYSDGDSETRLLELFRAQNYIPQAEMILTSSPSWAMRYHLSPERENLLSWIEFDKEATLLEVGAGCGALTGLLCDRVKKVTAVELTRMRSEIIKNRHKDKSNLEIFVGDINAVELEGVYDYVTCIGVLEYAARFSTSDRPYDEFLARLRKFLKPGGKLILAIENKFGLKYWAGCNEDHTGRLFESLENYPKQDKVRTFSRGELAVLLKENGFPQQKFYYPLPDYKLPLEIFSDQYLPSTRHEIRAGVFPTPEFAGSRELLFDERLVAESLTEAEMFPFFANSFLVIAGESE